jgi:hypothetical protein
MNKEYKYDHLLYLLLPDYSYFKRSMLHGRVFYELDPQPLPRSVQYVLVAEITRLLKQQTSITVYRSPIKENKLLFYVFHLQPTNGSCRCPLGQLSVYIATAAYVYVEASYGKATSGKCASS